MNLLDALKKRLSILTVQDKAVMNRCLSSAERLSRNYPNATTEMSVDQIAALLYQRRVAYSQSLEDVCQPNRNTRATIRGVPL
jgi:hypothetical protein